MRSLLPLALICLFFTASPVHSITHVCITAQSYGYDCQEFNVLCLSQSFGFMCMIQCLSMPKGDNFTRFDGTPPEMVITEDGYILGLQRIPRGRRCVGATNESIPKKPILLQHGILMDGFTWVVSPPGEGLAYALADEGFDVWIANTRGTRSSRGHKLLDANVDAAYWAWTWVELAKFDLTANVDFVHNLTGQKVNYIAHSLGTLTALTAFSQHKLVDKVNAAALLSPIAYLKHMTNLVQLAAEFYGDQVWLRTLSFNSFSLCHGECSLINYPMNPIGFQGNNCCLNPFILDLFLKYEPQSTSTKNIMHLAQMVRSGKLSMYDYGNGSANLKNYGVVEPPAYDLSNIPADLPLFLGYGGMDAISDVEDVERLIDELKIFHQEGKLTCQLFDDYAHADFVMATDAKERLHRPLIEFFNSNEHSN
ncbi:Triacylglycerol lipase 2 [Nymphaea thermarum]|nr:Triacylglycerol lipase 2 [Nymphaea thermarum]